MIPVIEETEDTLGGTRRLGFRPISRRLAARHKGIGQRQHLQRSESCPEPATRALSPWAHGESDIR